MKFAISEILSKKIVNAFSSHVVRELVENLFFPNSLTLRYGNYSNSPRMNTTEVMINSWFVELVGECVTGI